MPEFPPSSPREEQEINISESSEQSGQLGQSGRDVIQIRDSVLKIINKPVSIATIILVSIVSIAGIIFAGKHNFSPFIMWVDGTGTNIEINQSKPLQAGKSETDVEINQSKPLQVGKSETDEKQLNSKATPILLENLLVSNSGDYYIIEAAVYNSSDRDILGNKISFKIGYSGLVSCNMIGYTRYVLSQDIHLNTSSGNEIEFDTDLLREAQGLPNYTVAATGTYSVGCGTKSTLITFDTSQVFFRGIYTMLHIKVPKNFKIVEDQSFSMRKESTKKKPGSSFLIPFELKEKHSDFYSERNVNLSIYTNSQGEISFTDNSSI